MPCVISHVGALSTRSPPYPVFLFWVGSSGAPWVSPLGSCVVLGSSWPVPVGGSLVLGPGLALSVARGVLLWGSLGFVVPGLGASCSVFCVRFGLHAWLPQVGLSACHAISVHGLVHMC